MQRRNQPPRRVHSCRAVTWLRLLPSFAAPVHPARPQGRPAGGRTKFSTGFESVAPEPPDFAPSRRAIHVTRHTLAGSCALFTAARGSRAFPMVTNGAGAACVPIVCLAMPKGNLKPPTGLPARPGPPQPALCHRSSSHPAKTGQFYLALLASWRANQIAAYREKSLACLRRASLAFLKWRAHFLRPVLPFLATLVVQAVRSAHTRLYVMGSQCGQASLPARDRRSASPTVDRGLPSVALSGRLEFFARSAKSTLM